MAQTPPLDGELDTLLEYIHERRNFDFRGYKRPSLSRRIVRRMQAVGVDDYQRYMDILEANPGEFVELFNSILINVTSLLRDRDAWEVVAGQVLPAILQAKGPEDPIRIWSAGCASGEEAYTLAVLVAEAVGEDRFREHVKIYATDADGEALVQARLGRYAEKDLVGAFGEQRSNRFFEMHHGEGGFRPELRRSLIFGQHDLVQDPPISKIDLLACRNTLMYFTSEAQHQILASFHFAINPGGILFLGRSEALAGRLELFQAVDTRQHLFRRAGERSDRAPAAPVSRARATAPAPLVLTADGLFEQSPVPHLTVGADGSVLAANLQARRLFSIGSSGLGSPLKNGVLMFDPSELRRMVEEVLAARATTTYPGAAEVTRSGDAATFDMVLAPMEDRVGVSAAFLDVSRYQSLANDLERSKHELEAAYEELHSAVEELETTNEELQSTNEELETTNEELHSTNEELETMNEELQSTNEELEAINNELRVRSAQVDDLNGFLESILASLQSAVVVLGTEMEVRAWNRQAGDLWGLRADEVHGLHFLNLDIGFPVETLGPAIRACLAGRSEGVQLRQEAVNRRGRTVDCTVTISPLVAEEAVRGVILLMDAVPASEAPDKVQTAT